MLDWQYMQWAVRPLRLIFWGGLLWIFDITFSETVNGEGFRCDILDDTVATLMIAWAIFKLSKTPVSPWYVSVMKFIKVVAIASVANTAIRHFIFPAPWGFIATEKLLGICQTAATVMFCKAMERFCEAANLHRSMISWRRTFLLFIVIYVIPVGLLDAAGFISAMNGEKFQVDVGMGILPLLVIFVVPLVHLFISTSRMRQEGDSGPHYPAPGGFEVI